MKILLAGPTWPHEMYERACARALHGLGVEVVPFYLEPASRNLFSRVEFKYTLLGPSLRKLQQDLLAQVEISRPDVLLIWLGASVVPKTLQAIKQRANCILASYVHDDPFAHRVHRLSPAHHRWYWRAFLEGLPIYDLALFSKELNVDDAYRFGARKAAVLRQFFVPEVHRPRSLTAEERCRFACDVAFAGHYEPDRRVEYIRSLVEAGLKVNLYTGGLWERAYLDHMPPTFRRLARVGGEEYAKALVGAGMCLCFVSKINRDQYTTRCFEIPACGRLLLSERTEALLRLFEEDQEAVFFSTPEELTKKALWLRDHPQEIERIAQAGRRRLLTDGHSVYDRMRELLLLIENVRTTKSAVTTHATGARPFGPELLDRTGNSLGKDQP